MKCTICREELELQVGQDILPNEIKQHLSTCAECNEYWKELNGLTAQLGEDKMFHPTEFEISQIERIVFDRMQTRKITKIVPLWVRLRYAVIAASVIIVAGISVIGYRMQWVNDTPRQRDSVTIAQVTGGDSNQTTNKDVDIQEQVLKDVDLSSYEQEISLKNISNTEGFLDSLSNEELQYLEQNFDVKGLL